MDTDFDENNFIERIRSSEPKRCEPGAEARLDMCRYCYSTIFVRRDEFQICQSVDCIQKAITDRQCEIEELELAIPRARNQLADEVLELERTLETFKSTNASELAITQIQSLLAAAKTTSRFYAKDNRVNRIISLQEQISELARRVSRPSFDESFRKMIWERDSGICYLCHKQIEHWSGEHMEIDHVHPRSKGGSDEEHNLRAAHPACNLKKSDNELSSRKFNAVISQLRRTEEQLAKERLF